MVPSSLTVAFLVAVNLIPLFGVLVLEWSLFSIMVLYWIENGIIGLFNIAKIGFAEGPALPGSGLPAGLNAGAVLGRVFTMVFFTIHYGLFWTVHGVFVFALFGSFASAGPDWTGGVTFAALAMLFSHGVSFVVNFLGKKEYLGVSPQQQMGQPYGRVVVLHVTILAGGFLVAMLGTPIAALVVLISLKTIIDVRAHLGERHKAEKRLDAATPSDFSSWTETRR